MPNWIDDALGRASEAEAGPAGSQDARMQLDNSKVSCSGWLAAVAEWLPPVDVLMRPRGPKNRTVGSEDGGWEWGLQDRGRGGTGVGICLKGKSWIGDSC
jgi:hypothetical protein